MESLRKRKKTGQYKPKQKNEVKLSSYIRKEKYELGKNIRND